MSKNPSHKSFHMIVPVWGREYCDLFVNVCLPMLLTPGNLGVFSKDSSDEFVIVTTWEDMVFIRQSSAFARLENAVNVKIILIDGLIDLQDAHAAMSACYGLAMKRENIVKRQSYFIFLTPDSFWSEGTFQRLKELAESGYKAVMVAGLRTNAEDMSRELMSWISKNPENPSMPLHQLIGMVIDHMHQLTSASNWLSKDSFQNVWPSHIYWINKPDKQLVAHCFHMHPLMVMAPKKSFPIKGTIDGAFLDSLNYPLSSYYVVQGEFIGVELSPADRNFGQPLGAPSLPSVLKFALLNANSKHRYFFSKRVTLNGSPGTPIPAELEILVSSIVQKIQNAGYAYRIVQRLKIYTHKHHLISIARPLRALARKLARKIINFARP